MKQVLMSENVAQELWRAYETLRALEEGGVSRWEEYEDCFANAVDEYNRFASEGQKVKSWEEYLRASIEYEEAALTSDRVYILWEDAIIQGIYSCYDEACNTRDEIVENLSKSVGVKYVSYPNENNLVMTVTTNFGEIIEYVISDGYEVSR